MKYKETPDITLKMIIDAGIIKPGAEVYASTNLEIVGHITNEGGILLSNGCEEILHPYPSGAARSVTKSSVNGWKFWLIKIGSDFQELRVIRELYRKKMEL
jgi:hypothetical protein